MNPNVFICHHAGMYKMLTTLIYRSQSDEPWSLEALRTLTDLACIKNMAIDVTGILLFTGRVFFQVLEGPEAVIDTLFNAIRQDTRHYDVVELMRDYAATRRFVDTGMYLFDLRLHDTDTVTNEVLRLGTFPEGMIPDDRVYRFTADFIAQGGLYLLPDRFNSSRWAIASREYVFPRYPSVALQEPPCQFALQPIVDPLAGEVVSFEALIRSPSGGSPEALFSSIPEDRHYIFDLESKAHALALMDSASMGLRTLSVNLLPGTLHTIPGAVDYLLILLGRNRLRPEQLIIEVTEAEVINGFDEFYQVLKQIRRAGIGLAIDDFGAGYSGLSLLTRFQPDRLKIDMALVRDIHQSGAKQAIVMSVIQCCADLKITIIAEGVEKLAEWCWLQAAGIRFFQGFLFACPQIQMDSPMTINWPVSLEQTA